MGQTSMLEPIFQQAVLADLDVLMPLMGELYAHDGLPFDESAGRAALQQILSHDHFGRVYLIQVDEATVGYLVITFGLSLE